MKEKSQRQQERDERFLNLMERLVSIPSPAPQIIPHPAVSPSLNLNQWGSPVQKPQQNRYGKIDMACRTNKYYMKIITRRIVTCILNIFHLYC